VEEFLRGTFLGGPNSSIIAVSSLTGEGLEGLKQALIHAVGAVSGRDAQALARLPIDRVFTMKGFGTVVTGTLVGGTIRKEQELETFPSGRLVRVRGVQVHGKPADRAVAGERTALNLAGASTDDLSRGMTLAPPATLVATRRIDVRLRLLPSAPRPLKDRARLHFHAHTMETVAQVVLYQAKQIVPGDEGFAQLRLPEAALLLPGDRFIMRQFSPVTTIGGGIVLDAAPIPGAAAGDTFLQTMAGGDPALILRARIARRQHEGISLSRLIAETAWNRDVIEAKLSPAVGEQRVLRIGDRFAETRAIEELKLDLERTLERFHKKNPLVGGIGREELREQLRASAEVFAAVAAALVREKKLEIAGDLVRLAGRGVAMKDEEAESKKIMEDAFAAAGLKVPALREVMAGLKVDRIRAQKIVTLLLRDKTLIKISEELVFHRSALEELRRQIAAYSAKSSKIDVAQFKELTGVSRKYAIPLLEYLDRERVTRRVGDERVIL